MEAVMIIILITMFILAVNNIVLRKELQKKIDFDYEEYLLYRKSKG